MIAKNDISIQTLRVPAGWIISKNIFYNVQPYPELQIEGMSHDEVWFLFGVLAVKRRKEEKEIR
jgi:hypothetical protein